MTSPAPNRPIPMPDRDSTPFWEGQDNHELRFQRCTQCSGVIYPAGPMCPQCQSFDLEWFTASGKGSVYSWTVVQHQTHPAFVPPYTVLLVETAEGPRVIAQLRGDASEIEEGTPLRITWDDSDPEQKFMMWEVDR